MQPILVEVVAYAPTGFYHCTHCEIIFKEQGLGDKIHAEQLHSAMPADLLRAYAEVSQWANALLNRYGAQVTIKVIDAASIEGVWKALRYGARQFPAVIVNQQTKFIAGSFAQADAFIEQQLTTRPIGN
jgi:hypothetical protein